MMEAEDVPNVAVAPAAARGKEADTWGGHPLASQLDIAVDGDGGAEAEAAATEGRDAEANVPTPRPRCGNKLVCCDPGDDAKAARKIFRVMDVEEETIVSWAEFYLFVRHSCVVGCPACPPYWCAFARALVVTTPRA
jgi:hypothetical protein